MTVTEIEQVSEKLRIAIMDPNHTGIKQLVAWSPGKTTSEQISFEPIHMYNLGHGDPTYNGELILYNHLKNDINVLFDVGARDDTHYLTENHTEYHLFEPDPNNYKSLTKNLQSLDDTIKVFPNEYGLGDTNDTLEFFGHVNGSFMKFDPEATPDFNIKVRTLDDYTKEHNITHIDFLKIDVEGFELHVLKGAENMLPNIDYIQFEYGDDGLILEDIVNYLHEFEFTYFMTLATNGLAQIPITNHKMMCNILACRDAAPLHDIINVQVMNPKYT